MIPFFRKLRYQLLSDKKPLQYLRYALGEIILVVIGILIALQINNWNEQQKNRETEAAYLEEMLLDFEQNLQKSNEVIAIIEKRIPALTGLLSQSALARPTISPDSINASFELINDMPAYQSTDRVYDNLVGSGDFKLITNRELKMELAKYYKVIELLNLVQATHEMELVNSFQPFILEYLDFQAVAMIRVNEYQLPPAMEEHKILEILGDRKFRNIITLKLTILTDLLEINRNVQDENKKLVTLLRQVQ